MVHLKLTLLAICLVLVIVNGEIRVARSPQFGGFSQASAQAGAGGFGGPRFYPRPPIFGPRPPFFGGNFGRPGPSISISKSISIGGGGSASSSAGSQANGK